MGGTDGRGGSVGAPADAPALTGTRRRRPARERRDLAGAGWIRLEHGDRIRDGLRRAALEA